MAVLSTMNREKSKVLWPQAAPAVQVAIRHNCRLAVLRAGALFSLRNTPDQIVTTMVYSAQKNPCDICPRIEQSP